MPVNVSYIPAEDRLDLSFRGNLDVSVSQPVCDICKQIPSGLRSCIIDLSDIERLFDSGVALLQMLYRRLAGLGTTVVILSDRPEIRDWFPAVVRTPAYPGPGRTRGASGFSRPFEQERTLSA